MASETRTSHEARMTHPIMIVPEAFAALQSLSTSINTGGLSSELIELVHLRASQINGCGTCVDGHAKLLKKAGTSDERIISVSAWREAPYYSDTERAALALTEAVTRLSDREDPVPDDVWDVAAEHFDEQELASLVLAIASINLWNRMNVAIRQPAGVWNP